MLRRMVDFRAQMVTTLGQCARSVVTKDIRWRGKAPSSVQPMDGTMAHRNAKVSRAASRYGKLLNLFV